LTAQDGGSARTRALDLSALGWGGNFAVTDNPWLDLLGWLFAGLLLLALLLLFVIPVMRRRREQQPRPAA
jgi:hypothetical protein